MHHFSLHVARTVRSYRGMRWFSSQRGFTLIELLVVMAVLLLLIIAFGAYWLAGRPHARLASAANDLVSDIRLIRQDAVKRGAAAASVGMIDFTSTTRYRVVDTTGTAIVTRNYVPTAGEIGASGEYNSVVLVAQPADLYACSNGMINDVVPMWQGTPSPSGCTAAGLGGGAGTLAVQLNHPDVDTLTAGNQPDVQFRV